MKRFLLRELRRQLPIALGLFGLGILVVLLLLTSSLFLEGMELHVDTAVLAVAIGAPWVLGATVLAPDVETGADAFLATLPVSRWRLLGARVGVAFGYTLLALGGFSLLLIGIKHGLDLKDPFVLPFAEALMALFLFPAGLLASVAVRRTLPAFLLTPVFLLAPTFIYALFLAGIGAPSSLLESWGVRAALPPVLVLAALLAYAGARGEQSMRRPLLRGGAVLGAGLLLVTLVTSVAYAYQCWTSPWGLDSVSLSSPDGRRIGVVLAQETEWGHDWERRRRPVIIDADRLHDPWELPAGTRPYSFSPDGAFLLATNQDGRWELWDCGQRRRLYETHGAPLPLGGPVRRAPAKRLRTAGVVWRYGKDLVWRGGTPYWVTTERSLLAWDNSGRLPLPASLEAVEGVAGTRLLLRLRGGARAVCQLEYRADPRKVCMELPSLGYGEACQEAALGPRGQWLFLLGERADGVSRLWVSDAGANPLEARPLFGVAKDFTGLRISISPDGRHAIVDVALGRGKTRRVRTWRVELNSGKALRVRKLEGFAVDPEAWSPSGRFVTSDARLWDLEGGQELRLPQPREHMVTRTSVFLSERSVLRLNEYMAKGNRWRLGQADVVDLRTQKVVPFALLGSTTAP